MSNDTDTSASFDSVVARYRRIERAVSWGAAILIGLLAAGLLFSLPLWQGLLAAAVVVVAFRVPLFTTAGAARLRTEASPAAVRDTFAGPQPPVLALQWAVADEVTATETGANYEISYLFGLRSITMSTTVTASSATSADFNLQVTAGDKPWGTYAVTLTEQDGATLAAIEVQSDRRFGLRALPAWLVSQRYYDAALSAQGYTVVTRERSLSLRWR